MWTRVNTLVYYTGRGEHRLRNEIQKKVLTMLDAWTHWDPLLPEYPISPLPPNQIPVSQYFFSVHQYTNEHSYTFLHVINTNLFIGYPLLLLLDVRLRYSCKILPHFGYCMLIGELLKGANIKEEALCCFCCNGGAALLCLEGRIESGGLALLAKPPSSLEVT